MAASYHNWAQLAKPVPCQGQSPHALLVVKLNKLKHNQINALNLFACELVSPLYVIPFISLI